MIVALGAGIPKPRFRFPCNGCGLCCHHSVCEVAQAQLKDAVGPCPFLEWEDQHFRCGLVSHPSKYLGIRFQEADFVLSPLIATAIGIGQGCSMEDNDAV